LLEIVRAVPVLVAGLVMLVRRLRRERERAMQRLVEVA
jgi:hypothetical protein